ncbi:MAG TPA: vegetative protein [Polyangia bacterium]|nr:vegetative protein [Polyangia bacterium]
MADETKSKQSKAPAKAARSKTAKAPKAAAADPAVAGAEAAPGETCRVEKCQQAVRAKGYCRKHFIAWRRGDVGDHHRYKTCSKEGCRKPRTVGGLCDEHAGKTAGGEAAAAG